MSSKESQRANIPPPMQLMQSIWPGALAAQPILAAAKFGLADLLKDGSRSIEDLAQATGTHTESLQRLLRAVTSLGIFQESSPGHFRNSDRPWTRAAPAGNRRHYT